MIIGMGSDLCDVRRIEAICLDVVPLATLGTTMPNGSISNSGCSKSATCCQTCIEVGRACGSGIGGRNLEVALSAAIAIENLANTVIFTLATDGDDGPTHCAGAMVCGETVEYGRYQNKDAQTYLNNNDSYTYFQSLNNHLIITGPTGTNLNDVTCVLTYPP